MSKRQLQSIFPDEDSVFGALVALREGTKRLGEDHQNARRLAEGRGSTQARVGARIIHRKIERFEPAGRGLRRSYSGRKRLVSRRTNVSMGPTR